MKLYFLILWLSASEPKEMTFPTMAACQAFFDAVERGTPVSRCMRRDTA